MFSGEVLSSDVQRRRGRKCQQRYLRRASEERDSQIILRTPPFSWQNSLGRREGFADFWLEIGVVQLILFGPEAEMQESATRFLVQGLTEPGLAVFWGERVC